MRVKTRYLATIAIALTLVTGSAPRGHTPISSRFTYNQHLFPIFRDRCGSCHIEGGVAPMSLVSYQAAFPWTQSIREEVMGLRMPPWQAEDGFGDFKNGHVLPAHEMDMMLEWSAGGYPQGPRDQVPETPVLVDTWHLGEPSVVLEPSEPYELDAATSEVVRYFVLPSRLDEEQILVGADFRPGARAVVRGAALFLDETGAARRLDEADSGPGFSESPSNGFPMTSPVAVFTPGQLPVLNHGAGYRVPAHVDIVLRVHYKKSWITEGTAFSDQSRVGLHLASGDAAPIETTLVRSPESVSGRTVSFTHEIGQTSTILALFPEVDIDSSELVVEAVKPDGDRVPMLWLREPDNGWPTRFWFDSPVVLPAGSILEVTAALDPAPERHAMVGLLGDVTAPIRFALDYVAGKLAAAD